MVLRTDLTPLVDGASRARKRNRSTIKPTFKGLILWHLAAVCYYLCQSLCNGEEIHPSNIVDLSYEFNNDTIYWVTTKPLFMNITHNGTAEGKGFWYQVEEISAGTHGGTHLDAPCHFARGKWCVSDIPVNRFVTQGVVIDISNDVGDDPNVHLAVNHIINWEEKYGKIPDGSLLLVRTGWARFWPDRQNYAGTIERNPSLLKFPSITPEAAEWIVKNRRIVGLGIDTMSVDIPGSAQPRTHQILENENIYGIENVNNDLASLPPRGATVYVMPMKLKGASGAPCRVFAILQDQTTSTGCRQIYSCNMILLLFTIFSFFMFQHVREPI